jgi:serine/threonine protein kinase
LFSKKLAPRLIDFGLAFSPKVSANGYRRGTKAYWPPEARAVSKGNIKHFMRQDVWCLGILLYNMIYPSRTFKADTVCYDLEFVRRDLSLLFLVETQKILPNMLNINKKERYTIDQVINHPFFKDTKAMVQAARGKVDFLSMVPGEKLPHISKILRRFR